MIVTGIYFGLFILSIIAMYLLVSQMESRRSAYYVILFTMITIVCLAYFSYSIAKDTGMALVANQFSYLDGTFVLMFFMFCIMDLSNIRVKGIYGVIMLLISLTFLILAFTAADHNLFYTEYNIGFDYGAAHLETELGPVYNLYVIYIAFNVLVPLGILIYSYFVKRKISYKYTLLLALVFISIFLLFIFENVSSIGMDLLPIGYVIMEYAILAIVKRIGLYDVTLVAETSAENYREYGYIIFDTAKCYVGASDAAKYYFPELETLDIDRKVTNEFISNEFVDWIDSARTGNASSKIYEREDRKLVCNIKEYTSGKANRIYGYIVEIRDDTEQQNLIIALNEMNESLERAVDEANSANRSKSLFLANMSHEIRTPINAIMGMNQIAMRECEDDRIKEYMANIENASINLLSVINDILDISKIEAGKIEIVEDEYYTAKLIKDVSDIIEIKTEQKNLEYVVDVAEDIPVKLYGDENHIRQIMVNLLNNAVKYTEKGKVELHVSIKTICEVSEKRCELEIVVRDSGIGIRKEDIGTLFESFTRLEEKRNKNIEGTGLGLAITKKYIDGMGGSVDVDSKYGEGSIFTVTIPQRIVDETHIGEYNAIDFSKMDSKDKAIEVDASGVDVLVVDDNEVNLKVAKGLLTIINANVTLCKSGKQCIEYLKNKKFDIILLDHMMPEMDGIEVLHIVKNMSDNISEDAVYIAMTANAIAGIEEEYIREGFDDYLCKPVRFETLCEVLSKYISSSK